MNETTQMTTNPAIPSASPVTARPPAWKRIANMGGRSMASIADQGASAAINFLCSVFVGRLIGAEGLGIFAMTSVLVMTLRSLQGGAVLEPMSVFGSRRSAEERGGYLGFVVMLQLLWIGGISALLGLGSFVLWQMGTIDLVHTRTVVASLIFANVITFQYMMRRQFYVDHQPYSACVQSLAYVVVSVGGLWLYKQVGEVTIVGMYLVLCVSSFIVCGVQAIRLGRQVRLPDANEKRRFSHDHWTYGRWILLAMPATIAYYQGYFLLCGSLLSTQETGYLKAVDSLVAPFTQVAIGLSLMFVPMIAKRIDDMSMAARVAYTRKLFLGMLGISSLYAAVAFFFGPTIVLWTFGEKLAAAGPVLQKMALIPLFIGMGQPASIMLTVHQRSDLRFYAVMVAAIVTFVVGVPLILNFGLAGATWGMCVSQGVLSAGIWVALLWLRYRHADGKMLAAKAAGAASA